MRCRGARRSLAVAAIALGLPGLTGPVLADAEETGGLGLSVPIASGMPAARIALQPPLSLLPAPEAPPVRRPGISRIDLQAGAVPLGSGPRAPGTPTLGEVARDVEWRRDTADQIWGPANSFSGF